MHDPEIHKTTETTEYKFGGFLAGMVTVFIAVILMIVFLGVVARLWEWAF